MTAPRLAVVLAALGLGGCRVMAPPSPPALVADRFELVLEPEARREETSPQGRTLTISRSVAVRAPAPSRSLLRGRAQLRSQLAREPLSSNVTVERTAGEVEIAIEADGGAIQGDGHLTEVILHDATALHPTLLERVLALQLRRGGEVVGEVRAAETGALVVRLGAVEHQISPTRYDIGYLDRVEGRAIGYVTAAPRDRPTERIAWLVQAASGEPSASRSLQAYFLALLVHGLFSQAGLD